ncbi:MAG: hypothetical protein RL735_1860, partial [Pseudomonadota bacterium]
MQVADHGPRPLIENMGINLCCRDIGMAEQFLHDTQISPILEKVAGKSVAQDMRADEIGPQAGSGGA